jgi:DNA-nicking Smr family endonuclease
MVARCPKYPQWVGKLISEIADEEQREQVEVALDIIRSGDEAGVSFSMDEADVRFVMTLPWVATASDGGVKIDDGTRPHPRSFGTFTRKIGRYAIQEKVIPLEQAIRSARAATGDAAAREARRTVEDAIRTAGAAKEAATDAAGASASAFEAGQRVRLLSGLTGDVIEVREDGRLVVAVGSMRMVAEPGGTEVVGRREARKEKRVTELDPGEASLELDLRGLTGDEAEATTIAALDAAVLAEQPYLRIIHGMGTGVVRERVRQVLQRDRRVKKFDYAPRPQGGVGVTIAEFA